MKATFDFTGATVLVTGGAQGIGLAVAKGFNGAGATTFVVDADEAMLATSLQGTSIRGIRSDVTSSEQVDAAVAQIIAETGRIDVLVNNAGILRDRPVWKLSDDDWDSVIGVHMGGTFRFTRACVPHFRQQKAGRIINITSYTGLHGNFGQANYGGAKAGIIGFTKTVAKELASFGITVNAISPSAETRMFAGVPDERKAELAASVPLGRFGQPSEMFPPIAFLASEQASYVTGVVLPIDGGQSM